MAEPVKRWRRRSSKFALMAIGLAGIAALAGYVNALDTGSPPARAAPEDRRNPGHKPPVPVLAATPERQDVPLVLEGVGSVQAYNTVTVKSRVDGNIVKLGYREGQFVHKGDLLVQIDPRPFQAQFEQAQANQAKDTANLDNARRDLARVAALVQQQLAATRQPSDTQKALVAQLEAQTKADQAQIDTAKLNLDYASITSPIDGVTGLRLVDVGNLVTASAGTPLVTVTQIQPIFVTFTLAERDLDRIRRALAEHPLPVLAYNGEDDREIARGTLQVINNTVDQSTGTVQLKSEFANQDRALWPGQFVNAHLVLSIVKNGLTVPTAAVQMGPKGAFVYVVGDDSRGEPRSVTVTQVQGGRALIGKGLALGERIVVSGQSGLSPGAEVVVKPGSPGSMVARQPEIGPEGVGSTGINTGPDGIGGAKPR